MAPHNRGHRQPLHVAPLPPFAPATSCPVMTLGDLAVLFRQSMSWMVRNHKSLCREHHFPEPLPGFRLRWDAQAVQQWLAKHRGEAPPPPIVQATATTDDWGAELDRRAAVLGQTAVAE